MPFLAKSGFARMALEKQKLSSSCLYLRYPEKQLKIVVVLGF